MKNMNVFTKTSPKYWYLKDTPVERASGLSAYIKILKSKSEQKGLIDSWKMLEKMYGVKYNVSQTIDVFSDSSPLQRIKLNAIKSVVDTTVNKVGKNKPLPFFLTDGGNFDQQTKSKRLTQYIEGHFYEHNLFDVGKDILRSSLIKGCGLLKYFIQDDKFKFEKRESKDLLVDLDETKYVKPSQNHEICRMSKQVLMAKYPNFKTEIEMADCAELTDTEGMSEDEHNKDETIIEVIESWVFPVGERDEDAKKQSPHYIPGKHCIAIDDTILFEEDYHKPKAPFVIFPWDKPLYGFWGSGMAESVQSLQIELNKLLRTWQLSLHLGAVPKLWKKRGTALPIAHLNNKIGAIVEYDGEKPEADQMLRVPPELLPALEFVLNQIYQMTGVSVLAAQSVKPAGLNSGKALNTFNDIESERFITYGQRYEDFFLDVAEAIIEMSEDLEKQDVDMVSKAHLDNGFKELNWSDVKIERAKFIMKAYPVSFFSTTPAAKFQEVGEMINMQMLDPTSAMKLLDFPDLKAVRDEMLGIDKILEKYIVEFTEGKYTAPDPYMDLETAQRKIQLAYHEYKSEGLSENKLDLFRQYLNEIAAIKNQQAQQLEQQAAMVEEEEAVTGLANNPMDDQLEVNPDLASEVPEEIE